MSVVAYFPGLSDFWTGDDIPNIVSNHAIQIESLDSNSLLAAATANESGPLKRPIPSLSFGLNYYFSGKQFIASDFKAVNLVIHIINGLLVYFVALYLIKILNTSIQRKVPATAIALFVASVWGLHPIQLTAVLYPVQRMASLSAMFVFAGLLLFIMGRSRLTAGKPRAMMLMYTGIGLGTLLGAMCKENALLLPFLALTLELTLFSQLTNTEKKPHRRLVIFYTITALIPGILAFLYLATHPGMIMNGYAVRNFTITERLMTEARILFIYIKQLLYPVLSGFYLNHDDIAISKGLLQPWTTLVSTIAIFLLAAFSLLKRNAYPILSFAILWFFIAHAMESSVFALRPMYEHRNYVASFGIAFCCSYYIYMALNKLSAKRTFQTIAAVSIVLCLAFITHSRSEIWSTQDSLSYFDIQNSPDSAIAQANRAKYLIQSSGSLTEIYEHLRLSSMLNYSNAVPLITMSQLITTFRIGMNNNTFTNEITDSTPTGYQSPLIINKKYVEMLGQYISREVGVRLENKSISPDTISVLSSAISTAATNSCVASGQCNEILVNAFKWADITLHNTSTIPMYRAMILSSRAKMRTQLGDYNSALKDLDSAYQNQPEDVNLLLEKLVLLARLKDLKNAKVLIKSIESHPSLSAHHLPTLKNIKDFLQI